jgi:hypothetical protein
MLQKRVWCKKKAAVKLRIDCRDPEFACLSIDKEAFTRGVQDLAGAAVRVWREGG